LHTDATRADREQRSADRRETGDEIATRSRFDVDLADPTRQAAAKVTTLLGFGTGKAHVTGHATFGDVQRAVGREVEAAWISQPADDGGEAGRCSVGGTDARHQERDGRSE
jgi:hypothetical protein